jgi:putative DNA primase/helicase
MAASADIHQIHQAIPDLREIVARLGGDLSAGGRQANVPGPGHSNRDRSLSLRVSDDGTRVLFNDFSGAHTAREIFAYLGISNLSEYKPTRSEIAAAQRRRQIEAQRLEAEKLAFCSDIWSGTAALPGTAAARYLWNRGQVLDGCADLRFHPAAPRKAPWSMQAGDPEPPAPAPALVGLARNGRGEPRGLHVTYVTEDGQKAFGDRSRLMFGPMTGCALRLMPIGVDGRLAVGEGLETAAAFQLYRAVPTWPTFSTSGLRGFEVPLQVRHLIIAADHDENGAGLAAAEALAERASSRCDVEIHMPDAIGDWDDTLMRGGH